ncbi:MAG: DUF192 domain-containing protein [Candidatus Nanoarchaeia archaeon]
MKKIIFLLFLFLLSCQHQSTVSINDQDIIVEIADTFEERAQGLMFREHLDEYAGMIFIYPKEQHAGFWMKNTLISLDIIFIDKDFKIVDIHTAQPCVNEDECIPYGPTEQVQYVLEVNAGYAEKNGIKKGDFILFNL